MKKLLLLILFIFPTLLLAQKDTNIYDFYLQELISFDEEKLSINYESENIEWRKSTVQKITSDTYRDPSFLKTKMVLHMLRYKLGDREYSNVLRAYKSELESDNDIVTIISFISFLENHTKVDLSDFYNDWFVGKGFPSYNVRWFQNESTKAIQMTVEQSQSDASVSFFEMPLPLRVSSESGESQMIRLELSKNKQSFSGSIPFTIKTVEIDPEFQLISSNNKVKLGVDQGILNTTISLYPNPAKNMINIQNYSDAVVEKVSIYNMLGKLVIQEDNPIAAINLKPLSLGMHLVKIETSQGTLHKTILKEQ